MAGQSARHQSLILRLVSARRVLIVDDEPLIRWSLAERLRADGYEIVEAAHGRRGDRSGRTRRRPRAARLQAARRRRPRRAAAAARPRSRHARRSCSPRTSSVETVVEAMKAGAFDYATKPFDLDDVALRVARALETTRLRRELRTLRDALARPFGLGLDHRRVRRHAARQDAGPQGRVEPRARPCSSPAKAAPARTWSPRSFTTRSSRAARPFLNITCSALPEALLESRALRPRARRVHRRAPAEARPARAGRRGHGVPRRDRRDGAGPSGQAAARLEEKAFRRVGGLGDVHVDVRVIAATNRDLEEHVRDGPLPRGPLLPAQRAARRVPPLRARGADIVAARAALRRNVQPRVQPARRRRSSRRAERRCTAYGWPGNVRELRNLIERAVLLCEHERLEPLGLRHPADRAVRRSAPATAASTCRPAASTSRTSSGAWWCRRSSAPAATRRAPRRCSACTATRSGIESRSSG